MSTQDLQEAIGRIPEAGVLMAYQRGAAQAVRVMHATGRIRSTPQLIIALGFLRTAGHTPEDMAGGDQSVSAKEIQQIMEGRLSYTEDIIVEIADRAIAALNRIGIRFCGVCFPIEAHQRLTD